MVQLDRLGGKSRIRLGEDRPHLEYLPEVVRLYGTCMLHGHAHIYQALPRLLTLWFELGTYVQGCGGKEPPAQVRARGRGCGSRRAWAGRGAWRCGVVCAAAASI